MMAAQCATKKSNAFVREGHGRILLHRTLSRV
jgi:hypothetical protein